VALISYRKAKGALWPGALVAGSVAVLRPEFRLEIFDYTPKG